MGVELLVAVRALQITSDFLPEPLNKLSPQMTKVFDRVNQYFPPVYEDQYLRLDMEKAIGIICSCELLALTKESF